MALGMTEIEQALLSLPPDERAAVIERGLVSLERADDMQQLEIDAAWQVEIDRRVGQYIAGDAELIDADERFAQRRAKLTAREA